jgi:hypothetical protein
MFAYLSILRLIHVCLAAQQALFVIAVAHHSILTIIEQQAA